MKAKLHGLSDMLATLKRIQKNYAPKVVAPAVENEAERLLEESKSRAPIKTGALRDSGHVVTEETREGVRAEISFDVPYAAVQHERLDLRHDVGGPKFLESVLNENRASTAAHLAQRINLNDPKVVSALGGPGKKDGVIEEATMLLTVFLVTLVVAWIVLGALVLSRRS